MSAPDIAALLNDRHGFSFPAERIVNRGRTTSSTLFEASTEDGAAVQVEVFDGTQLRGVEGDFAQLDAALEQIAAPGAFRPRHVGRTEDGRMYVLREATVGTPLRDLLTQKQQEGQPFTDAEVRDLLTGAAEAIDAYNAAGHAGFLARSVNTDQLLLQPTWSEIPVKLALVGPNIEVAAAEDNLHDFWNVVAQLTGKPVDEEAAARYATAAGYLNAVTTGGQRGGAEVPPAAAAAPAAADSYRKPPEPYPSGYQAAAAPAKKRSPWPWIIALLTVALIAMAAAWYFTTQRGQEWNEAQQEIAEAYPGIVAKQGGKKGWQGLQCESATPDYNQEAKIRCAGEELGVSVAKYYSPADRDADLPDEDYATVLGSGECLVNDFEIPGAYPAAFAMAPRDKDQYLIIVNGYEAEERRLDLPICE